MHSSLGITSLLKRQPLKHNTIDRDKILVPPNWDSWGKIRVLRDGFDVEATSQGWSHDLQSTFPSPAMTTEGLSILAKAKADGDYNGEVSSSAVAPFEDWIRDLSQAGSAISFAGRDGDPSQLEMSSTDTQEFLGSSLQILETHRSRSNDDKKADASKSRTGQRADESDSSALRQGADDGKVSQHIGPVQFNMGGIQVDADDMVQRLKVSRQDDLDMGADLTNTDCRTVRHTVLHRIPPRHRLTMRRRILMRWTTTSSRLSLAV